MLLTVVGFTITIIGVKRSKSAAERANRAANATLASIARYDAIADLAAAMSMMDEIKRLQRYGAWPVLPDRYSELRRRLGAIRNSGVALSDAQRGILAATAESFVDLERRVERAVAANNAPPNPPKLNEIVSAQIDEVHGVLVSLQRTLRQEQ